VGVVYPSAVRAFRIGSINCKLEKDINECFELKAGQRAERIRFFKQNSQREKEIFAEGLYRGQL
jgi:hypothetical protein